MYACLKHECGVDEIKLCQFCNCCPGTYLKMEILRIMQSCRSLDSCHWCWWRGPIRSDAFVSNKDWQRAAQPVGIRTGIS